MKLKEIREKMEEIRNRTPSEQQLEFLALVLENPPKKIHLLFVEDLLDGSIIMTAYHKKTKANKERKRIEAEDNGKKVSIHSIEVK